MAPATERRKRRRCFPPTLERIRVPPRIPSCCRAPWVKASCRTVREGQPGLVVSFPERRAINKEVAAATAVAAFPDNFSARAAARQASVAKAEQAVGQAEAGGGAGLAVAEGWDAKPSTAFFLVFTPITKPPLSTPDPIRSPATKFPSRAITTNDLAATLAARSKFPIFTMAVIKHISSSTISTKFSPARSIRIPLSRPPRNAPV